MPRPQDADPQRPSSRLSGVEPRHSGPASSLDGPYASSLQALRLLTPVRPLPDSRPSTPGLPFSSSALTCHAPKVANRLGLALNVGEEGRVAIALQPLLDEGPEDDLKAHREFDGGCRLH